MVGYYRRSDHLGHLKLKLKEGKEPLTETEIANMEEVKEILPVSKPLKVVF